jgi:cell division protein FtsQ
MRLRPFLRKLRTDLANWSRTATAAVLVSAVVAGCVYYSATELWPGVRLHPYFRLRSVKITCDSSHAEPVELAARAGLYEGTSLWDVDVEAARGALEAATWVKEARVARRFPDHVSVEVYRREPLAATVASDGPYLIGDDGMVYREEGARGYADMPDVPFLTGWERADSHGERIARLRASMALLAAVEAEGVAVSQIDVSDDGTLWLYPEAPRVAVRVGRDVDVARLSARLSAVLGTLPADVDELEEIDLSYADRAVLRVREGSVASVLSGIATTKALADLGGERTASLSGDGDRG